MQVLLISDPEMAHSVAANTDAAPATSAKLGGGKDADASEESDQEEEEEDDEEEDDEEEEEDEEDGEESDDRGSSESSGDVGEVCSTLYQSMILCPHSFLFPS
jgi:hypothetical protein